MAERVERLTNLLALLLETREPLSLVQIADELSGQYPDAARNRRAAFERDKALLREVGVPIEQEIVAGTEHAGQTRYWVDRDRYELAGLELDDDEMRALQVALAATRPGSSSGQEALWKLGGGLADAATNVGAVVPDVAGLAELRAAVSGSHPVEFRYRGLDRRVDPWGLLLRNGFWYVVGFDHARTERRTFRVDRIEGAVDVDESATFERPDDFDVTDALPADPKLVGATESEMVDAHVLVAPTRAVAVRREVGEDRVVTERDDGSIEVLVPCANRPAFRSWVLAHLDDAEVIGPPDLRSDLIDWLRSTVRMGAAGTETT